MKIAILNNYVPFIKGGAELLAETLQKKIIEFGHQAIIIKIPFYWHPPNEILKHILAAKSYRLINIDKVIALKFPAYLVEHPNKTIWLLHQFRQVYDLWGTNYQDLPNNNLGQTIKNIIYSVDNKEFKKHKIIYTNSHITSQRLKKYNNFDSQVLYPPPLFETKEIKEITYEDYIYYPSRITSGKRQYLAVEAMAHTKTNVKLLISGKPETYNELLKIKQIIKKNNLQKKVKIIHQWIPEEEKQKYFLKALACVYIPYQEDSYGYTTVESFLAKKPVITTFDSGDVKILVKNKITGLITNPSSQELAQAFDYLYENKNKTKKLGENAYQLFKSLNITWENVINKLI